MRLSGLSIQQLLVLSGQDLLLAAGSPRFRGVVFGQDVSYHFIKVDQAVVVLVVAIEQLHQLLVPRGDPHSSDPVHEHSELDVPLRPPEQKVGVAVFLHVRACPLVDFCAQDFLNVGGGVLVLLHALWVTLWDGVELFRFFVQDAGPLVFVPLLRPRFRGVVVRHDPLDKLVEIDDPPAVLVVPLEEPEGLLHVDRDAHPPQLRFEHVQGQAVLWAPEHFERALHLNLRARRALLDFPLHQLLDGIQVHPVLLHALRVLQRLLTHPKDPYFSTHGRPLVGFHPLLTVAKHVPGRYGLVWCRELVCELVEGQPARAVHVVHVEDRLRVPLRQDHPKPGERLPKDVYGDAIFWPTKQAKGRLQNRRSRYHTLHDLLSEQVDQLRLCQFRLSIFTPLPRQLVLRGVHRRGMRFDFK